MTDGSFQELLQQPYERERWLEMLHEVMPGAALYLTPQDVGLEGTRARRIVQLGEIPLADGKNLALLEVETDPQVDLSRNRAGLRHLAARFIDLDRYHGVFATFRAGRGQGDGNWRLTFAARETVFGEQSGDLAVRETAPKRYTYLLGPHETCRTAAQRILSLRGKGNALALADITDAFSVEKLNKEFFRDFTEVFNEIAAELRERFPEWGANEATEHLYGQEAQILLNRLLFLYFVQRKGWLHRKRDYLFSHFKGANAAHPERASYYEDFLFPVFRILATEWKARSKVTSNLPEDSPDRHDLPFLNGGLFLDEEGGPDDSTRRRRNLGLRDATFQRIFDGLLERYNFTIREDSPLDQEVAIDPEMLGKIFEALILREEAGDSGGKSRRHDTGSHYTPRPIVHYLCRDALAAWLEGLPPFLEKKDARETICALLLLDAAEGLDDTAMETLRKLLSPEEAGALSRQLDDLRACDPAVGSGAFPIGLLHEMLNLKRLAKTRARGSDPAESLDTWLYDRKKEFIHHSIYGVDLQERAIEICKLRLWLSLMVDHALGVNPFDCDRRSFQQALRRLEPLPNLDYKIRRANSLVDMIHGHPVELRRLSKEGMAARPLQALTSAKLAFFTAQTTAEKRRLQLEIYDALAELGQIELTRVRNDIAGIGLAFEPEKDTQLAEVQAGLGELGRARELARAARRPNTSAHHKQEILDKLHGIFGDPTRPTFVWQLDFAEVFQRNRIRVESRGDDLSKNTGEKVIGFDLILGNPPYIRIQTLKRDNPALADYFKRRYHATSKGNYDLYVVFVERGLELLHERGELAYVLPHKFFNNAYGEPLREMLSKGRNVRHVIHFGDQQIFPGATNYVCLLFLAKKGVDYLRFSKIRDLSLWLRQPDAEEQQIPLKSLNRAEWNFSNAESENTLTTLIRSGRRLLDLPADMSRGSSTGDDEVFIVEHGSDLVEAGILRIPVFAGDFRKYYYSPNSDWRVIFPYERSADGFHIIPETQLERRFPRAFRYLKQNRDRLNARKGSRHWYGFSAPRNLELHDRADILVPLLADHANFGAIPAEFRGKLCPMASGGFSVTIDPAAGISAHYVLGVLNTPALFWMLRQTSNAFRGGWITCTKQYFGELPVPETDGNRRGAIERLAEYLLFLRAQPSVRESTALHPRDPLVAQYFEQWVDAMGYELFFPEALHNSRTGSLRFFDLFAEARLPRLESWPEGERLPKLRAAFERLYDPAHPLRGALFALQSIPLVRTIEGQP